MLSDYQNAIKAHTDFHLTVKSQFHIFAKYICNNKILLIKLTDTTFDVSSDKTVPMELIVDCLLLDILDIEYPREFEALRANQDSALFHKKGSLKEYLDELYISLEKDFQNVYCRNVYKACEKLEPSDTDLEKTLDLCQKTVSPDIDITILIKILSHDNRFFKHLHKGSPSSSIEDTDATDTTATLGIKQRNSSDQLSEVNLEKPDGFDINIFDIIIQGLVKISFKKVKERNLFVEQTIDEDTLLKSFKNSGHDFISEFVHTNTRPVLISR